MIHGLATGPPSGDMCPVPPPVSDSLLVLPSKARVLVCPHPGTQDSRPISPTGPLQPPSITCPVTCPQSPAGDELSGLRLFLLSVLPLFPHHPAGRAQHWSGHPPTVPGAPLMAQPPPLGLLHCSQDSGTSEVCFHLVQVHGCCHHTTATGSADQCLSCFPDSLKLLGWAGFLINRGVCSKPGSRVCVCKRERENENVGLQKHPNER